MAPRVLREANLQRLQQFFAPLESLPFDDRAAEIYGLIRAQLMREGRPIGGADVTLVTRNEGELRHVAGLRIDTR